MFGDASRLVTRKAAGVERARMVLITFHRQQPAARIARALHHEYPHPAVIAASLTDQEASHLLAIPGLRVYPEKIMETFAKTATHPLAASSSPYYSAALWDFCRHFIRSHPRRRE